MQDSDVDSCIHVQGEDDTSAVALISEPDSPHRIPVYQAAVQPHVKVDFHTTCQRDPSGYNCRQASSAISYPLRTSPI